MTYENILVTTQNNIATLTINRPSKLNALNVVTINELHKAFKKLEKDNEVANRKWRKSVCSWS